MVRTLSQGLGAPGCRSPSVREVLIFCLLLPSKGSGQASFIAKRGRYIGSGRRVQTWVFMVQQQCNWPGLHLGQVPNSLFLLYLLCWTLAPDVLIVRSSTEAAAGVHCTLGEKCLFCHRLLSQVA